MPTSAGLRLRTVGDIVQVLSKFSKSDADAAELEICKTAEEVAVKFNHLNLITTN